MQQLELIPEKKKPLINLLASFDDSEQETLRYDRDKESSFPPNLRYHPDIYALNGASTSRYGDWAEKRCAAIALEKGAEVFENVSCVGKADFVMEIDGELYRIDVKGAYRRKKCDNNGKPHFYWAQREVSRIGENVWGVLVVPAASGIYCRWLNSGIGKKRSVYPLGLRDFWAPALQYD